MNEQAIKKMKRRRDETYAALKNQAPLTYDDAIRAAGAVALSIQAELHDAAEIEWAFVSFACKSQGVVT